VVGLVCLSLDKNPCPFYVIAPFGGIILVAGVFGAAWAYIPAYFLQARRWQPHRYHLLFMFKLHRLLL